MGILSRLANEPRETHWHAGMRILKYIKGSSTFGITYQYGDILHGYCDFDGPGDIDSIKSIFGYWFLLDKEAILWTSVKRPTVSLSSTKAEYKSVFVAECEAIWLRRVLTDIGMTKKRATLLQCDSQSCIALTKNLVFHARTKHLEILYHYM